MDLLKERIKADGQVLPGNILKVGSFLNHQIDVELLDKLAFEFKRIYGDIPVTRVLTVEASGIAVACAVARLFHVPVVFAKKNKSNNISGDCYATSVYSYTNAKTYNIIVSKKYLSAADKLLLVDDFLANGSALSGLVSLGKQAGAAIQGACIVIEKGFQDGRKLLRSSGLRIESLAIIESMSVEGGIKFRD